MWRAARVAFLVAGRFLTRLPLPDPGEVDAVDAGRAALFYPAIGLLLGVLLWGLGHLLAGAPAAVAATLVLGLWVWSTGALHLDGLSDSADGWVGGLGSRERTLEIMRDPRAGAMGVVSLFLVLTAKWATLSALLPSGQAAFLLWIPFLARVMLLALFLTTPYARASGMASATLASLPRPAARVVVGGSVIAVVVIGGAAALAPLLAMIGVFVLWRRALMRRLGGFTGDTAGALVELTEAAALVVLALGLG